MIRSDAGRCPVSAQCGILGVAKSTCYWVLEHPEAERADPYEKDVERVWRDSGKVYGARKIRHALGHEGVTLSRRRINRIMKGNGMAGSCSKAAYRPRPVLLQCLFDRFGSVFPQCGLMVFPGVVIVSR